MGSQRVTLEKRYIVPLLRKVIGSRAASNAAANDRDFHRQRSDLDANVNSNGSNDRIYDLKAA
jgi:hypothetical protein